jgi:hypothetical protein
MYGRFFPRFLAVILVLVGIAGVGFYTYQMGLAQGAAQGVPAAAAGATVPYYGFPHPFFPFWGFGCLIPLVVLFLIFGAMRMMFWRGHMMGHGGHGGHWRDRWSEGGVPPMFEEWHKRSHEGKTGGTEGPGPEGKTAKV